MELALYANKKIALQLSQHHGLCAARRAYLTVEGPGCWVSDGGCDLGVGVLLLAAGGK
jgi:hypothetical protein